MRTGVVTADGDKCQHVREHHAGDREANDEYFIISVEVMFPFSLSINSLRQCATSYEKHDPAVTGPSLFINSVEVMFPFSLSINSLRQCATSYEKHDSAVTELSLSAVRSPGLVCLCWQAGGAAPASANPGS
ncbi:unnamed protein product [Chrysodeixis includens]|uniref:Uncharacterized protein n=1 Tax=Chrysodeixis includens TaxID=689277 RepID=A0A9N8PY83_CHRIL|nr:unnamed protein product [Chrysodeixis includens]